MKWFDKMLDAMEQEYIVKFPDSRNEIREVFKNFRDSKTKNEGEKNNDSR